MCDFAANGKDPFAVLDNISLDEMKLFNEEKELYGNLIDTVRVVMEEYFNYWPRRDLVFIKRDGKSAEHEFELPILGGDALFNGRIDKLAKTADRRKWLVEHKSFTKMPGIDDRWRDLQSVSYLHAMKELDYPQVDGVCWDYIRSKEPTVPKLLSSGFMSQAAIVTLPTTVKKFLREHKLPAREYRDFLKKVSAGRDEWFARIYMPVSQDVAKHIYEDFETTVREMVTHSSKSYAKNIGRHCSWCDFKNICSAELQGSDADYVKQREFTIDEKKVHTTEDTSKTRIKRKVRRKVKSGEHVKPKVSRRKRPRS